MGQWQIRVKGKQREPVNLELVVQAVIALGRQLWATEQPQPEGDDCAATDPELLGQEDES
jgi:hypothetical protein